MNEGFWTTGVIESKSGRVAWPDMTRHDAERLSPVYINGHLVKNRYSADSVMFADVPFVAHVIVPDRGDPDSIKVLLWMDGQYSRQLYGMEFPVAQEMSYYETMFEKHLGSAERKHKRHWGTIGIGEDHWTHDSYIAVCYHPVPRSPFVR